ncbi:MAG: tripartite tricarboxylate transporter TctB family protein [Peptococcales bacterium]
MKEELKNLICSCLFLVFGVFIVISTPIFTPPMKLDPLGSQFFPYLIGFFFIVISISLGLLSLFEVVKNKNKDAFNLFNTFNFKDNFRVILFCIILIISVYLIEYVHFFVGSFTLITGAMVLSKEKKAWRYAIVSVFTILSYLVFTKFFNVRL